MTEPWQALSHAEARRLVWEACKTWVDRGKLPSLSGSLIELVQAVSWLETHYGAAWREPGNGSCNVGAIQCHCPPCTSARVAGMPWLDATCFTYVDTKPLSDGSSKPYSVCFRRWPDYRAGYLALVEHVLVRRPAVYRAAIAGKAREFSAALHASRYYEGFGKTVEERISHHEQAVVGSMKLANAAIIGQPAPADPDYDAVVQRLSRAQLQVSDLLDLARASMRAEGDRG